jgi:hypothetical protein
MLSEYLMITHYAAKFHYLTFYKYIAIMLYILDLSLVKVQYYRMLETILLSALLKRQQFAILKMGVT